MDKEEIIFQQYKLYSQQKEEFINRSFMTNKFYLALIIILLVVMFLTKSYTFVYGMTSSLIFSGAGMAICSLWYMNVDSYNFLIKIKFSKVLDEIEKQLPVKPYTDEFEAIKDYKKNKREFMFADIQKLLAIFVFLMFFFLFIHELLAIILR